MAHHIESTDRFAFTGSRSAVWHGLGVEIPEGLTATEAFPRVGLNWDTELAPIYAEVPKGLDSNGNPIVRRVALREHRSHVRCDTDSVLGIVSHNYRPVQNMELAQFVDTLAGDDAALSVNTAGSLYGGKRVFCLVKLPKVIQLGADINETYVLVSNGHGGFASFSCYPTSIRVVCDNTLRWSERDAGKGIRFRHTGDVDDKVATARNALGIALAEVDKFEAQARALAGANLSVGQVRAFMESAYDTTFGRIAVSADAETKARLEQKRSKILDRWMENMDDARQRVPGITGTAWAALNAITQWHDHERGNYKAQRESDARKHSNLFGASSRDKRKALTVALAMI